MFKQFEPLHLYLKSVLMSKKTQQLYRTSLERSNCLWTIDILRTDLFDWTNVFDFYSQNWLFQQKKKIILCFYLFYFNITKNWIHNIQQIVVCTLSCCTWQKKLCVREFINIHSNTARYIMKHKSSSTYHKHTKHLWDKFTIKYHTVL